MRSITWYLITLGIPLLGFVICTLGGVLVYRRVKQRRMGCGMAALLYLVATAFPLGLAEFATRLGNHLAIRYRIYEFSGENGWGLFTLMVCYLGLAVISNLVLWVALGLSRKRRVETQTA